MKLSGYYPEEQEKLIELLQNGDITHLEYVTHYTPEMHRDFILYVETNDLEEDDAAAKLFIAELAAEEEQYN